jgi:hypothetical protein
MQLILLCRKLEDEEEKTVGKEDILEYLAFSAYMTGNIRLFYFFKNCALFC